jgi:hypothetical protein
MEGLNSIDYRSAEPREAGRKAKKPTTKEKKESIHSLFAKSVFSFVMESCPLSVSTHQINAKA